jgi:hypothetical protein
MGMPGTKKVNTSELLQQDGSQQMQWQGKLLGGGGEKRRGCTMAGRGKHHERQGRRMACLDPKCILYGGLDCMTIASACKQAHLQRTRACCLHLGMNTFYKLGTE